MVEAPSLRLVVRLPIPHSMQALIEASLSKRVVINAGRRAGKTTMAARKSIKMAQEGRKVLYTAPVSAQTDSYWDLCVEWLADAIHVGFVTKNLTTRTLTFRDGGVIVARTAYKPEHLRGTYADFLILDEYAYQNPEIWTKVGAPMLLDNNGDVWFISTPDLRNHFFILFKKAENNERWQTFHFSSLDNPHLSQEALAVLIEDMTDTDYRQEILAEFVEGEGSVFSFNLEDFRMDYGPHDGHRLVAGLDWGRKNDFTVLCIGCATCQSELFMIRFGDISYPIQRDRIQAEYDRYKDGGWEIEILAESNSMGLPNIEQLREDGVPVLEFFMSTSTKPIVVQGLRLALARRTWTWLDDPVALRELETYEMSVTPKGNVTYGGPAGLNDDTVVARMLMLHQALTGEITLGTL